MPIKALERRARAILKSRPAYREMVEFYLTVFRRQIEWQDRLIVHPEQVTVDQLQESLRGGKVLADCYDPGLDSGSLLELWAQMKADFRAGNEVLRQAMDAIDAAEDGGTLVPAAWLLEQRPGRQDRMTEVSARIGVDESILTTLARAVTFPHWELVSDAWLPVSPLDHWKRSLCPVCGGIAGLVELRKEAGGGEGTSSVTRRCAHCSFCASRWIVPPVQCIACGSLEAGHSKYYFNSAEPELRIDFCGKCRRYIKVVDTGRIAGRIHVGLELLASSHLDAIARERRLSPLKVSE